MNRKNRIQLIKHLVAVSDKVMSSQFGERTVTRTTDFNCYLDGVRHSWTDTENCFKRGALIHTDPHKQAKIEISFNRSAI